MRKPDAIRCRRHHPRRSGLRRVADASRRGVRAMVEAAPGSSPLERAAALVRSLRPDWQRPERFHEAKAEALAALRAVAADRCAGCEATGLRERLRRAHALLRAAGAGLAHHRRLLAEAAARARRRRRRAEPDPRQAVLPFG